MKNHVFGFSAAILWLVSVTSGFADTFTVINTDDTGPGSLRQAILDANNHHRTRHNRFQHSWRGPAHDHSGHNIA